MAIVFFDFDSTVVKKETLDDALEYALTDHPERARLVQEIEEITRLGMEGKKKFMDSVRERLRIVPLSRQLLEARGSAMRDEVTDGMRELFEWLQSGGHTPHIVSGGFLEYVAPVAKLLGIPSDRVHTNLFIYDAEGTVTGPDETVLLWTNEGKTPVLQALRKKYPGETFVMIGDGMNDFKAYESGAADHFIGFGGNVVREAVKAKAPHFANSASEVLVILQKTLQ